MISLGVPDSHGRFSYWLPSFKVELPSPSREIGTLVLVISSSLLAFLGQIPYIYLFVLRDFVTEHPKFQKVT